MHPGAEAAAVDFPDWAWNRTRNLYKPNFDSKPPSRVTPEHAREHNAKEARGAREFFVVDPSIKFERC